MATPNVPPARRRVSLPAVAGMPLLLLFLCAPFAHAQGGLSILCNPKEGPGQAGLVYQSICTASGGTPPYAWSTTALPAGLTLSATTGTSVTISGKVSFGGSYFYNVNVTDSSVPTPQQAQYQFVGNIVPSTPCLAPSQFSGSYLISGTNFAVGGGSSSVSVATFKGCEWGLSSDAPWITINGPTIGGYQDIGVLVPVAVASNPNSAPRTGHLIVTYPGYGSQSIEVDQNGTSCSFTVTPTTASVSAAGGNVSFSVSSSPAGCNPVFQSDSSNWLYVSPSLSVPPNYTCPVPANAGGVRTGNITIVGTGGQAAATFTVTQGAGTAPLPAIVKVTNAASYATGAVSPGEIISIFANASNPIGPTPAVQLNGSTCPSPCTSVPTTMGGVQVVFLPSGVSAPLTYVSATQINCVVPYEVQNGASLQIEVKYLGQTSNGYALQYASTKPGIFTALSTGSGLAAILQYDSQGNYQGQNSSSNPASAGWYLTFYVTGEGAVATPVTGRVTSSTTVAPLVGSPNILIDNLPSTVAYFAEAYGFVSGLMQVNAIVPAGVHTGQAVSLSLSMGGNSSQNGVTLSIQ